MQRMQNPRADRLRSGLVEIVRDFLVAHRLLGRISQRFQGGRLRFQDVQALIGDSDHAVLFRLKERCHSLFRSETPGTLVRSGALFDLAVGSLFHEAMKFRENVYQQEVYAPRVQRLRDAAGEEARDLLREFEKVLAFSPDRLAETLHETEGLFEQTGHQLRQLLGAHADNGLVVRFLLEQAEEVAAVFPEGLEDLLAGIYGGPIEARVIALHSYLESAHFEEALLAIEEIGREAPLSRELARLANYAKGMQAFLIGDFEQSVRWLSDWVDATPSTSEAPYARSALNAISRVGKLQGEGDNQAIETAAQALCVRLEPIAAG